MEVRYQYSKAGFLNQGKLFIVKFQKTLHSEFNRQVILL